MGNIDQEGFLSKDIDNFEKHNLSKYAPLFNFYKELNSFCQEYSFKLSIPKSSIRKLLLAILYIRSLSTFQSVLILLSKGIINESKVLLRTQFEIVFQLVAIIKNEHYETNYLGQELIQRKKMLNKTNYWSEEIKNKLAPQEISKMMEEVKSEIRNKKIKEISTKQFAQKAELNDSYNTAYAMLCLASHANVMDLKNHFIFGEKGIVESFKWGPSEEQMFNLMATSIENQLIILKNLEKEFETKSENKIENLSNRFYDLFREKKSMYEKSFTNNKENI